MSEVNVTDTESSSATHRCPSSADCRPTTNCRSIRRPAPTSETASPTSTTFRERVRLMRGLAVRRKSSPISNTAATRFTTSRSASTVATFSPVRIELASAPMNGASTAMRRMKIEPATNRLRPTPAR